jgi:hypothetical protein
LEECPLKKMANEFLKIACVITWNEVSSEEKVLIFQKTDHVKGRSQMREGR